MRIPREDYHKYTKLYLQQSWLASKKDELKILIDFCEDRESKDLVFSLLERFFNLDQAGLSLLLNEISDYIMKESGFTEHKTQLLALTWDDEADSGQKVLDMVKHPIFGKGWHGLKTVNTFGKSIKYVGQGRDQIILIDEFIGSGRTLRGRINYLKKNIPSNFDVKCCFLAGIKQSIDALSDEGIEIFCPLQLDKGISEYYKDHELTKAESLMLDLELKLAHHINKKDLYDYSFGYGGAEALYTMEGCSGNTPNSTFPIFWWLKDKTNNYRKTILTRVESGFQYEED